MTEIAVHGDSDQGKGGFAAGLTLADGRRFRISGGNVKTTANRMQLAAAIESFRHLNRKEFAESETAKIATVSEYLCNAFNKGWLERWETNGWKNKDGQEIRNSDLWQELRQEIAGRRLEWTQVKEPEPEFVRLTLAGIAEAARRKGYWTTGAEAPPAAAAAGPKPEAVAGEAANAAEQALLQNRQAMECLQQAWRICQENGHEMAQQPVQKAMNHLERQAPNLERAAQGTRLLNQATG